MKLYIKYMVSQRCKMMVKEELNKLDIPYTTIELGVIILPHALSSKMRDQLNSNLKISGLELLDDQRSILVERIKNLIIEMIHYSEEVPRVNYSDFISKHLGFEYAYLAKIFSEVKGITIQQFIIINKIERVKELLIYEELSLTEIAYVMHYSSVAHLSYQFKKLTGLTPTFFKSIANKRRKNLEDL